MEDPQSELSALEESGYSQVRLIDAEAGNYSDWGVVIGVAPDLDTNFTNWSDSRKRPSLVWTGNGTAIHASLSWSSSNMILIMILSCINSLTWCNERTWTTKLIASCQLGSPASQPLSFHPFLAILQGQRTSYGLLGTLPSVQLYLSLVLLPNHPDQSSGYKWHIFTEKETKKYVQYTDRIEN